MDVSEVCKQVVVFAYRSMALNEAARLMRDHHVGSLVVVEERDGGKWPTGMLTDRDIVIAVVARDLDPRTLAVSEVMTTDVVSVRDDDSVLDALALMRRRGVRRVPVVTRAGRLVGIVTLDDLLRIVVAQLDDLVAAISGELAAEARDLP
jgi:CBS domain-containing protein